MSIVFKGIGLKDWLWDGGSYSNKSWEPCWHNSWLTMINPDYFMNKHYSIKCIYDQMHSKSPPNWVTLPTCLHCDITHQCLMMGFVALHILLWMIPEYKEHHHAHKTLWLVKAGRVICHYPNNLYGIINHQKHIGNCFWSIIHRFKCNNNEPWQHCCQNAGWHMFSIEHTQDLLTSGVLTSHILPWGATTTVWHQKPCSDVIIGDKPFTELMITQFTNAFMHHDTAKCLTDMDISFL